MAVIDGDLLAGWTGWLGVGLGGLLVGEFILTGDIVPALLYLAPLSFGVAALIRPISGRPTLVAGRPPVTPPTDRW